MARTNTQVAELLRRYAAALALEGANKFKLRAYRRAAETIEGLDADVAELVRQDSDLTELPGIGHAISDVVTEIVKLGTLPRLVRAVSRLPPDLIEIATKPRLDPVKVKRVYKKLGIGNLAQLKESLEDGRVGSALGPRMEYHVRQGLDDRPRSLLWNVKDVAARIEGFLGSVPGVTAVSAAGSLRRQQDTVGDLNFLVAGKNARSVFSRFAEFGGVLSSQEAGDTERSFKLSSGPTVHLRWTSSKDWGIALLLATGSAAHVEDLKRHVSRRKTRFANRDLAAIGAGLVDEREVYAALGLSYIEPELREGRGEVTAAAQGKLPALVYTADLRGDLHMHTTASDGADSLADMAAAGRERGYEYIAITDHSQSLRITNGLSEERLFEQIRQIDKLNAKLKDFRILKSAEVDILQEGKLDYSNSALKELDCTICSIHSRFALNKEQQTERILRAMDNRYFTILGHASGRLLLKREGYELDMERVMEHAKANGCFFEINSSPDRLDLSDEHAKMAKDRGIKIAINTDAHSTQELDFVAAGINQARRGWLEARDVLNTLPLKKLLAAFRR